MEYLETYKYLYLHLALGYKNTLTNNFNGYYSKFFYDCKKILSFMKTLKDMHGISQHNIYDANNIMPASKFVILEPHFVAYADVNNLPGIYTKDSPPPIGFYYMRNIGQLNITDTSISNLVDAEYSANGRSLGTYGSTMAVGTSGTAAKNLPDFRLKITSSGLSLELSPFTLASPDNPYYIVSSNGGMSNEYNDTKLYGIK